MSDYCFVQLTSEEPWLWGQCGWVVTVTGGGCSVWVWGGEVRVCEGGCSVCGFPGRRVSVCGWSVRFMGMLRGAHGAGSIVG